MTSILIVDDDPNLLKMLERTLIYEGYKVATASNGIEGLQQVDSFKPDLVIVDWMMPKLDGVSMIQTLRAEKVETMILMLTARDAIENRVEGLESGADDYLVKPFAPAELVARIHSLLRRIEPKGAQGPLVFLDLNLDSQTREVKRGTKTLFLTLTEFNLLNLFLHHPKQVLERTQILSEVWGYDFCGDDNVLEIYIGYLRKKLEASGESRLIQTVRGVGYVLREE